MTLREVNRVGEVKKNIPKLRFKGYEDAWEQRKFGDVGTVAMCKRIFKEETSENGEVPFYKIGTFGGEPDAYISREVYEKYKTMYPYPKKGDILISASGSIGRTVEYTGKDEYFQDSNIVWLQHNKNIDNSFLKVLYSVVQWSCEGSTIKRLYNDNFLKTKIVIPNIKEQMLIGEYFGRLDNLITLHQRKLDELKNMKKTLLSKMFPKNGEVVPEIRFKGFTDAWEQRKLGTAINVKSGKDYKHLDEGDVPVYGTGGYMLSVSEALENTRDAIGIGRKGTIDKPFVLKAPFWTVDTLFYCIPKENNSLSFLYSLFQSINWKLYDESTGVPSLSKTVIDGVTIKLTSEDEQSSIGEYFESVNNLITLHQRKLDELKNMKKTLLQQMFV